MKRILGVSLAIAVFAAFGIMQSASSQGNTQEFANQKKIIARARHNNDDAPNRDAHPDGQAGKPVKGNGITYHGGPLMGVVVLLPLPPITFGTVTGALEY